MKIEKVLITPALAATYLKGNTSNRKEKIPVRERYVNDMVNGRWKSDTGELIKISKTGVLLDGQHRLVALIKANVGLYFHVAYGLEDSVFDVLDTGSVRNASDVFFIQGIKMGNSIPSIIANYLSFKNGNKFSKGIQKDKRATNAELLAYYQQSPEVWQSIASNAHKWYIAFAKIIHPSTLGGFYALFSEISTSQADSFFNQLASGIDITHNCIAMLRQKLLQDKMAPRKMNILLKNALIIKAWNFYRKNDMSVKLLKFSPAMEEYPTPC